jgi:hypothetical protein
MRSIDGKTRALKKVDSALGLDVLFNDDATMK